MTTHGEILIYRTDDGTVRLDVRLQDETVWLPQAMMAELFCMTQQNISLHRNNIYAEKELLLEATHKKYLLVHQEGTRSVQHEVDHYNLDVIISIGYRVKKHSRDGGNTGKSRAPKITCGNSRILREKIDLGMVEKAGPSVSAGA